MSTTPSPVHPAAAPTASLPSQSASVTGQAAFWATHAGADFPPDALTIARLSLFDCLATAIAGSQEPVSLAVRALVGTEGGAPQASAVGLADRIPARAAALLNGAAAHALDYDDTHFDYVGHPSVAVLPAALAAAEHAQASGQALLNAFLIGLETACRIGAWLGRDHYNAGFHQTATSGAFGATVAAARLLGLTEEQIRHALGLAATRASGLKCQFGTMGKPYHAGMAASTGVEAALLARSGFIARDDALECAGGFAATHQGAGLNSQGVFAGLPQDFRFTHVQYKFHACCHGIHPALEAVGMLLKQHPMQAAGIERVTIALSPQWRTVCCIPEPRTGLEAKFSLAFVAAMLLSGVDTAALDAYTDANCLRPDLQQLAARVDIVFDDAIVDTASRVTITTQAGQRLEQCFDLNAPLPYAVKADRLQAKTATLLGATRAEALWKWVESLPSLPAEALYPQLHAMLATAAQADSVTA